MNLEIGNQYRTRNGGVARVDSFDSETGFYKATYFKTKSISIYLDDEGKSYRATYVINDVSSDLLGGHFMRVPKVDLIEELKNEDN